jgi:hypothetical protein
MHPGMTNMAHYNWEAGFLLSGPAYPKAAAEYQLLLDAGNLDEIESLLMERLDSAPQDIAFFLPAYRTLIKRQETGRAEALLQLHVDCLKTRFYKASSDCGRTTPWSAISSWAICPPCTPPIRALTTS